VVQSIHADVDVHFLSAQVLIVPDSMAFATQP